MKSQKQSSNILTRKWEQFWCLHHWDRGLPVDIQYGKGYKYRYHCTICDKVIHRWTGEDPISGVISTQFADFEKDPRYNMFPPIRSDDGL